MTENFNSIDFIVQFQFRKFEIFPHKYFFSARRTFCLQVKSQQMACMPHEITNAMKNFYNLATFEVAFTNNLKRCDYY